MSKDTKVTQVLAADMAGVSRATIIRHIKDGKLSKDPNGKIDVSELVRVYGSDVLTPEQVETRKAAKEEKNGSEDMGAYKSEIEFLKKQLDSVNLERDRERNLLSNQIEHLKERLEKSEDREAKMTLLLTHQSKEGSEEKSRKEEEREEELKALKEAVARIEGNQNKSFFDLLFGRKKA